jgi:hypothetical protein
MATRRGRPSAPIATPRSIAQLVHDLNTDSSTTERG